MKKILLLPRSALVGCHSRKQSAPGIQPTPVPSQEGIKGWVDSGQAGMTNVIILMNLLVVAVFLLLNGTLCFAQSDTILGRWLTQNKGAIIDIYRTGDIYQGRIVWLKEPNDKYGRPNLDENNPDPRLRSHPILGLVILKWLRYDPEKNEYRGRVYNPDDGRTYKCIVTLKGPDKLAMHGYLGFRFLGKTDTWTRVK